MQMGDSVGNHLVVFIGYDCIRQKCFSRLPPARISSDHSAQSHNDQLQCHLSPKFAALGNLAPYGPSVVDVNYIGA